MGTNNDASIPRTAHEEARPASPFVALLANLEPKAVADFDLNQALGRGSVQVKQEQALEATAPPTNATTKRRSRVPRETDDSASYGDDKPLPSTRDSPKSSAPKGLSRTSPPPAWRSPLRGMLTGCRSTFRFLDDIVVVEYETDPDRKRNVKCAVRHGSAETLKRCELRPHGSFVHVRKQVLRDALGKKILDALKTLANTALEEKDVLDEERDDDEITRNENVKHGAYFIFIELGVISDKEMARQMVIKLPCSLRDLAAMRTTTNTGFAGRDGPSGGAPAALGEFRFEDDPNAAVDPFNPFKIKQEKSILENPGSIFLHYHSYRLDSLVCSGARCLHYRQLLRPRCAAASSGPRC